MNTVELDRFGEWIERDIRSKPSDSDYEVRNDYPSSQSLDSVGISDAEPYRSYSREEFDEEQNLIRYCLGDDYFSESSELIDSGDEQWPVRVPTFDAESLSRISSSYAINCDESDFLLQ